MKVDVIVGGQFGSEAKGHVAARVAERRLAEGGRVIAVRVAGPNAGHTAYDGQGNPWALRSFPAVAVVDPEVELVLAAGSEIDPSVLYDEIKMLEDAGCEITDRLYIDGQATVLEPCHIEQETQKQLHQNLGSTGKGVGAARAARLMRSAMTFEEWVGMNPRLIERVCDTGTMLRMANGEGSIIVEGTQGYGLGLHAGFYPYCTSSDCRSIDFLAMAGLDSRHRNVDACMTWVVMRTFPIRVAGNSGPLRDEMTWEELFDQTDGYIKPERTTVTKKVRRIGRWDPRLAYKSVAENGGPENCYVALTFVDYIDPAVAGATSQDDLTDPVWDFIAMVEQDSRATVRLVTTGPNSAVWL